MKKSLVVLASVVVLCLSGSALGAALARFTFQSQPGDWVGAGGSLDRVYGSLPGENVTAQIRRTLSGGEPAELLFILSPPDLQFASLFFGTDQLGIQMQPGYYPDAQRADFASPGHPGLDVGFNGRGSNTVTGNFTVLSVAFTPDLASVVYFLATFEQHSEGASPAMFGRFEYSAAGVLVPEPGVAVLLLAALGLAAVRLRLRI